MFEKFCWGAFGSFGPSALQFPGGAFGFPFGPIAVSCAMRFCCAAGFIGGYPPGGWIWFCHPAGIVCPCAIESGLEPIAFCVCPIALLLSLQTERFEER
jgi:hypothetical protein